MSNAVQLEQQVLAEYDRLAGNLDKVRLVLLGLPRISRLC